MNLDELACHMGTDLFRGACQRAAATAAGTGRRSVTGGGLHGEQAEIPHELADLVEGDLELAMALYRAMPCYANLMYVGNRAPCADLFRELRALLDAPDDARADPASYWLWCEPFEDDATTSAAAWHAMVHAPTERRLRRLLHVSGPVPWSAKGPVLDALAAGSRGHPMVWWALRDAVTTTAVSTPRRPSL